MSRIFCIILFLYLAQYPASAQTDTITVNNFHPELPASFSGKHSFAVFFTDTSGNRIGAADIWDRECSVSGSGNTQELHFDWKWYAKKSLLMHAVAKTKWPSLQPVDYDVYDSSGLSLLDVSYNTNTANVKTKSRTTKMDTSYRVDYNLAAFPFPMDLEIFSLLPFKQAGQQFVIPFYEPGSGKAGYYHCDVNSVARLELPGSTKIACWVLRITYRSDSYALFWITQNTRELLKMQEYYQGKYRYKVRLY